VKQISELRVRKDVADAGAKWDFFLHNKGTLSGFDLLDMLVMNES
jgi:hypothetical protein